MIIVRKRLKLPRDTVGKMQKKDERDFVAVIAFVLSSLSCVLLPSEM